jgi:hypothetical protein
MSFRRGLRIASSLVVLALMGCGEEETPTGSSGGTNKTIAVAAEIFSLTALDDCDAGSRGQGDFFMSVSISDDTGDDAVVLERKSNVLVQANSGEVKDSLGITAAGDVAATSGRRVLIRVSYYENDTGGPQVSVGQGYPYEYDAANGCWSPEDAPECYDEGGIIEGRMLRLVDNQGDACNVQLRWIFTAEQPR